MIHAADTIVVVTSGLGPVLGGIGVVSDAIVSILKDRATVHIWQYDQHGWYVNRAGKLFVRSLVDVARRRPHFILYEHVDLAQIHMVAPWLRAIPFGIFLHGMELWVPVGRRRRQALEAADLLIANSQFTAARARESNPWLPPVRVTWLGAPVPSPLPAVGERAPRALLVGRMARNEVKGHDAVLDAWPAISAAVPDAELLFVGTGDDESRLRERARGLRGVRFTGFVSDAERDELYRSSRLFLLPSLQEGFGLVAVEAVLNGMALVGVGGSVMEELFPPGHGVELADAQTGEAVARVAIPLLRDAELCAARARVAQAHAHRHYTGGDFALRFLRAVMVDPPAGRADTSTVEAADSARFVAIGSTGTSHREAGRHP